MEGRSSIRSDGVKRALVVHCNATFVCGWLANLGENWPHFLLVASNLFLAGTGAPASWYPFDAVGVYYGRVQSGIQYLAVASCYR